MEDAELTEEVIALPGRELVVRRPRDAEALIDEEAFEHEELMPYWAELWPSGVALARALHGVALRGRRVLELGCGGLALPSIVAALGGGRVTATDWAEDCLALASANAEANDASIAVQRLAWQEPEAVVEAGPWDLVLAADVLYERRNVDQLVPLLPRLAREVWLADPGRKLLPEFLAEMDEEWTRTTTADPVTPAVEVHRFRRRA